MLSFLLMVISLMSTGHSINRPVYKVILNQKGFAQFIQYDIDTPPLREFTFCTWLRVYELANDQTIFSYIAQGNNRIIRLWLDSGGHHLKLVINGREATSARVNILKDVWRHVCLSYQSDFGAWAIYIDAGIVSCEADHSLYGYVLPGGGSVIIGHGTANNGEPSGLEGEIFGANMILTSTIRRNVIIQNDSTKRPRDFFINNNKDLKKSKDYLVFSDLQTEEIHNSFDLIPLAPFNNLSQNYIKFSTPNSFVAHSVGSNLADNTKKHLISHDITRDVSDFYTSYKEFPSFWNLHYKERSKIFSPQLKTKTTIFSTAVPKISEFETPPPPTLNENIFYEPSKIKKPAVFQSIYKINESLGGKTLSGSGFIDKISDVEMPPPPDKNNKVYGQWTSSKFADSVLNYLKGTSFHKTEKKKVPATIPLTKVLDNFPYASEAQQTKLNPPLEFRRRNLKTFQKEPQINVQILQDDLRSLILNSHAKTAIKNVEITNRGNFKKNNHRKYIHIDTKQPIDVKISSEHVYKPEPFSLKHKDQKYSFNSNLENSSLQSIPPFLKSLEYVVEDSQNIKSKKIINSVDMYIQSLSNRNNWHNVQSYSDDYIPRHINMESENKHNEMIPQLDVETNKKHPFIRITYKPESHLVINTDDSIIIGEKEFDLEASNRSNSNLEPAPISKYNSSYLLEHENKIRMDDKLHSIIDANTKIITQTANNFDKHVKLGNALNERHLIGNNEEQNKQSFVGGDESVPDINKYGSDIDNEITPVPPSLGPRICKDIELYERVLYVMPDESIDTKNIYSPVKLKNLAIEFITENYNKCFLTDSSLVDSKMYFIDWNKTPIRLLGGAHVKTTTDLCGVF